MGLADDVAGAAEHQLLLRVVIGHHQLREAFQHRAGLALRQRSRQHRARLAARHRAGHRRAARQRRPVEVLVAQHAGGPQGGHFAVAVAGQEVRTQAQAAQQFVVAGADRADRRLRRAGLGQLRHLAIRRFRVEGRRREDGRGRQRQPVGMRRGVQAFQRFAHRWVIVGDIAAHIHVLRALAGEQGHDAAGQRSRLALVINAQRMLPVLIRARPQQLDRLVQQTGGLFGRACDEGQARGIGRRPRRGALMQAELIAGVCGAEGLQLVLGQRQQLFRAVRVQQHHFRAQVQTEIALRPRLVLLHDGVVVGAAEAVSAQGRAARRAAHRAQPRPAVDVDVEGAGAVRQFAAGLADVDGGRQHLVVQAERRLHHRRRAGGATGVADLRFDAANGHRAGLGAAGFEHRAQAPDLGLVAGLGAGAVRLHQLNFRRRDAGALIGSAHRLDLTFVTRRENALGAAVAGSLQRFDHRVDAVAVALGVFQALEHQEADAVAQHHAVGRFVEGTRQVALGQGRSLAEAQEGEDGVFQVDAAGQHHVAAAVHQFAHRRLDRGQAAGASGVHHVRSAAQVEIAGDAAAGDIAEEAGEAVLIPLQVKVIDAIDDLVGHRARQARVVQHLAQVRLLLPESQRERGVAVAGAAQNHPHPVFVHRQRVLAHQPGVQHCLLGHVQREDLRGADGLQHQRRQFEFHRIEIDGRHEAGAVAVSFVRGARVRTVIVFLAPVLIAVLLVDVGQGILLVDDIGPEII